MPLTVVAGGRPGSGRLKRLDQLVVPQFHEELLEVRRDGRRVDLRMISLQPRYDFGFRSTDRREESPDLNTDGIQAEISLGLGAEQDCTARNVLQHDS